jgi:type I site-specific restriction endonuclease
MNESETRAEYIDPKLHASGWDEVDGSDFGKIISKVCGGFNSGRIWDSN